MQLKNNQQKVKITQSQIQDLLKDSECQESQRNLSNFQQNNNYKNKESNSRLIGKNQHIGQSNQSYGQDQFQNYSHSQTRNNQDIKKTKDNYKNQSQSYGNDQFQSFDESKRTLGFKKTNINQAGQYYQSYGNQEFQNYEESKKKLSQNYKEIQKTEKQNKNIQKNKNKLTENGLLPIKQQKNISKEKINNSKNKSQKQFSNSKNPMIKTDTFQKQKNNSNKAGKTIDMNIQKPSKNFAYKYDKLQERQKQLLFTTVTEQNKSLRLQLSEKDKQFQALKLKYNILLQEKNPQTFSNAKQATLNKKLMLLQQKYNMLLKEKQREQQAKGKFNNFSKSMMAKTMTMKNNFLNEDQNSSREDQLCSIIDKLKQRLISTDKQLKTLQTKMNQGLDYTDQLQRKLKRVEQLEFRIQKMKNQAQNDRLLIENLKQKTKQQSNKIQELKKQKVHLEVCLKRAQMSSSTNLNIIEELQQVKREKVALQKSLRDLTTNFSTNLKTSQKVKSPPKDITNFQDSQELLRVQNANGLKNNVSYNSFGNTGNESSSSKPKFSKRN